MPEPNLPPLRLQMSENDAHHPHRVSVPEMERRLPELPSETRALLQPYELNPWTVAQLLVSGPPLLSTKRVKRLDNPLTRFFKIFL